MELRQHPLMYYRGVHNWPPAWTRIRGESDRHQRGEIGVLREIRWPPIQVDRADRFFLVVEDEGTIYMGCLLFDDVAFCLEVQHLLQDHFGSSMEYIGGLDIAYTL